MLKKLIAGLVIPFTIISISFAGSALNMREGNWEITSKMKMAGGMELPPNTTTPPRPGCYSPPGRTSMRSIWPA